MPRLDDETVLLVRPGRDLFHEAIVRAGRQNHRRSVGEIAHGDAGRERPVEPAFEVVGQAMTDELERATEVLTEGDRLEDELGGRDLRRDS